MSWRMNDSIRENILNDQEKYSSSDNIFISISNYFLLGRIVDNMKE
jgi:hypothetical protein